MAAERAIKKLDEQLNCAICLETYSDPKLLQCFHIFCMRCLVKLVKRNQDGQLTLPCPSCRNHTPIPANGVEDLQSAFRINELLEIREDLKKAKDQMPDQEGEAEGGATAVLESLSKKIVLYCSEHVDKELELYCETCSQLICYKCAVKGGKHPSHNYEPLGEAFEKYKEQVAPFLKPMGNQLKTINGAIANFDACSGKVTNQREFIRSSIEKTARRLHEIVDVRTDELINQLNVIAQGKLKGLAIQKDQMEIIQAHVTRCMEFVRESLETGNQGEVLKMKATIVNQMKELVKSFHPNMVEPNTEPDITFSPSPDVVVVCREYGQVSSPGSPNPSKCTLQDVQIEVNVGSKYTAVLQTVNFKDRPCLNPITSLQCELVSEITHAKVKGCSVRNGQSLYDISYQPAVKGRHQLHVKVEGQHIRGSPFTVLATSPVKNLCDPILTIGGVRRPWGVTINTKGEIVVVESDGHCVSVFSPSGKKIRSFGVAGLDPGQLQNPHGVAVDGKGNILVADIGNCCILKFTEEGKFLKSVSLEGGYPPSQFVAPLGITYNAKKKKIYVVDRLHRLHVLDSDLSPFTVLGTKKGQLLSPLDVTCDSIGRVYVADSGNCRVQVFGSDSGFLAGYGLNKRGLLSFIDEVEFLRMFSHRDSSGELIPKSIATDASDRVYVCNNDDRVSVFTSEGQHITSFGSYGEGAGQFKHPHGIAVSDLGVVYVCDRDNNRIQVF